MIRIHNEKDKRTEGEMGGKKGGKEEPGGVEKNCCQWKGLPGQLDLCVRVRLS